jgi:hypothetical protein
MRTLSTYNFAAKAVRIFLAALFIGAPASAAAQDGISLEYKVKASMIFKFIQYIDWPEEKLAQFPAEMPICIVGPNHFGSALKSMERELLLGRRVRIVQEEMPERLDNCMVAFFSREYPASMLSQLLSPDDAVLTIGETPDFLEFGGILNLKVDKGRVVFEANRRSALHSRINLSSRLLRISSRVVE